MNDDNTKYRWVRTPLNGVYVSDTGSVFNERTQRTTNGSWCSKRGQVRVSFTIDGKRVYRSVARLVAEAFVEVPDAFSRRKLTVAYVDNDHRNTRAENLQWVEATKARHLPTDWSPEDEIGHNDGEVWKRFRGSNFWVSSNGRVFSTNSMRMKKPYLSKTGYSRQRIRPAGTFFVHRMVAEAFIPEDRPLTFLEVNHKDGDKLNNSAPNLEWLTPEDHRKHTATLMPRGEMHPNAVLTDDKVSEARALYASGEYTYQSIANLLKCSRQSVTRAIVGHTYTSASAPPVEKIEGPDRAAKSDARKRALAATKGHREAVKAYRSSIPKRTSSDVLNAKQVMCIRSRLQAGDGPQKVADDLGYGIYTVMAIRDGRTYGWVEDEDSVRPRPGPRDLQRKSGTGLIDRKIVTKGLIEDVLQMRFVEEMPYAEIAKRVGMHSGTIKTIACGRHTLQKRGLAPVHET